MLSGMTTSPSFAELDALTTETLREQAFAKARAQRDVKFFWQVLRHLPDAGDAASLDGAPNSSDVTSAPRNPYSGPPSSTT